MKKIFTQAILIAMLFTATNVNAQRWDHGNNQQSGNHYHDNRDFHHDHDVDRGGYHDERRYGDRDDWYRHERREGYYQQPRVVYGGYGCAPRRVTFYFFPYANIYYNPYNHLYSFPFRGEWVSDYNLPEGVVINEPYREVYCNDNENIWAYNRAHIDCFRVHVGGPRVSIGIRF